MNSCEFNNNNEQEKCGINCKICTGAAEGKQVQYWTGECRRDFSAAWWKEIRGEGREKTQVEAQCSGFDLERRSKGVSGCSPRFSEANGAERTFQRLGGRRYIGEGREK